MTVKELSQLYFLKKEIENDKNRLASLKDNAYSPSTPNLSGMPPGNGYTGSATEKKVEKIQILQTIIEKKVEKMIEEQKKLENWIAEIDDSQTRLIFTLRFIECRRWWDVAFRVGGGNTADSVKKKCYRFLKECA